MPHITFIHGIANKPPQDKLLKLWRESLARNNGLDLGAHGVSSSMIYWADVMYASPQDEESAYESLEEGGSPDVAAAAAAPDVDPGWKQALPGDEQAWLIQLEAKVKAEAAMDEVVTAAEAIVSLDTSGPETAARPQFERIWLPAPVKKKLMEFFLRDVHHYLFNTTYSPRPGAIYQVQEEIRARFLSALEADAKKNSGGPHVVVSHSMGTVIAYDCLKRVTTCPRVDAFMTVGSPLGIDEIQDGFAPEYTRHAGFPLEKVAGRWVNVYDGLDPVAGLDPKLANDYRGDGVNVLDVHEPNWGRWRHDITKYLQGSQLRSALKEFLQL